jgi:hypothetical protein
MTREEVQGRKGATGRQDWKDKDNSFNLFRTKDEPTLIIENSTLLYSNILMS